MDARRLKVFSSFFRAYRLDHIMHHHCWWVASRPPTSGVLSRGIGMEGVCSVVAGLWGTGIGSTTLTENVHTIAVTKMGSRRAVELGAVFLILLSLVGTFV